MSTDSAWESRSRSGRGAGLGQLQELAGLARENGAGPARGRCGCREKGVNRGRSTIRVCLPRVVHTDSVRARCRRNHDSWPHPLPWAASLRASWRYRMLPFHKMTARGVLLKQMVRSVPRLSIASQVFRENDSKGRPRGFPRTQSQPKASIAFLALNQSLPWVFF